MPKKDRRNKRPQQKAVAVQPQPAAEKGSSKEAVMKIRSSEDLRMKS